MDENRMSISAHLVELRSRLIVCLIAMFLGMIVAYVFFPDVFYPIIRAPLDAIKGEAAGNPFVLKTPLIDLLTKYAPPSPQKEGYGAAAQLHYQSLTTPFRARLKVSLVIGIILALPVIAYEIWAFVLAGLYERERRFVRVYGPASFLLFVTGAALAYFVVLPVGIVFLLRQGDALVLTPVLMVNDFLPLVLWLLLGFGLIFQMPIVLLFLTKIGVVEPRTLAKSRRVAIVAAFLVAAVLTPPDPFTQIAMAIPLVALYEFSLLLSRLSGRRARAAMGTGNK